MAGETESAMKMPTPAGMPTPEVQQVSTLRSRGDENRRLVLDDSVGGGQEAQEERAEAAEHRVPAAWGDLGRSGEIWGNLGRSGEIWGDMLAA